MKKILSIIVVFILMFCLTISLSSCLKCELEFATNNYRDDCSVVGCGSGMGLKVVVPKTYMGKPVTEISGFEGHDKIKSVTLTENITEINTSAFKDCTSLKKVKNTSGLKKISSEAFAGCTSLEEIELNDIMYIVSGSAFEGTPLLVAEDNINYVDNWAVSMEGFANEIKIREGTVGLGSDALRGIDSEGHWDYPDVVYLPSSLKCICLYEWEYKFIEFHYEGTKDEWLVLINQVGEYATIQSWGTVVCSDGTLTNSN